MGVEAEILTQSKANSTRQFHKLTEMIPSIPSPPDPAYLSQTPPTRTFPSFDEKTVNVFFSRPLDCNGASPDPAILDSDF